MAVSTVEHEEGCCAGETMDGNDVRLLERSRKIEIVKGREPQLL